jgi:hypothetical protein
MPHAERDKYSLTAISMLQLLKNKSNKSNIKFKVTNLKVKVTRSNLFVHTESICQYKN